MDNPYASWFNVIVRRRPGQSAEEATSALRALQGSIREATLPDYDLAEYRDAYLREPFTVTPAPGGESPYGGYYRTALLALLWAARGVAGLLYGVEPRDLLTLGIGATVLVAVGVLAMWYPARRAAHTDPAAVLRGA